jgi:SRSO17 transposase
VKTTEYAAVTAAQSVDPDRWQTEFSAVLDRIAPRFARYEPLQRAGELMAGMVSGLDRKNCWTIAEHRGSATPDGLQHLLARASWDADAVRDDLRDYVVDAFGHPGAILVVDETGDVKKGTATVGVQRQYSGTAGRIENSQVAVYLTYAAPRGHALIDRALYLPKSWTEDSDRCEVAGIPQDDRGFATKPTLAMSLIDRAVAAEVPAAWVAGDEVYGADPRLRAAIRGHGLGYVLAVAANRRVPTPRGPTARGCAGAVDPDLRLAETFRRRRSARSTPVLLGLVSPAGRRRHRHRRPPFADPPQRCHRRTGLPALLLAASGAAAHPGGRGRAALAHRGILPSRQRTGRP